MKRVVVISEMEGEIRFSTKIQNQVSMTDYWREGNLTACKRLIESEQEKTIECEHQGWRKVSEENRTLGVYLEAMISTL